MARRRPRPRGWHVKDGDPPGTERFWDGEKWGPQPRQKKVPVTTGRTTGRRTGRTARPRQPLRPRQTEPALVEPAGGDGAAPAFEQGTVWARISARSADALLVMLPWYLLFVRSFSTTSVPGPDGTLESVTTANYLYVWLSVAVVVAYELIFTGMWGRTPGKMLVGLAVVDREDGQTSPGWGRATMRASPLLLVATVVLVPVLWVACVVAMWLDRAQRSVFDFAGGTMVVAVPRSR